MNDSSGGKKLLKIRILNLEIIIVKVLFYNQIIIIRKNGKE